MDHIAISEKEYLRMPHTRFCWANEIISAIRLANDSLKGFCWLVTT